MFSKNCIKIANNSVTNLEYILLKSKKYKE